MIHSLSVNSLFELDLGFLMGFVIFLCILVCSVFCWVVGTLGWILVCEDIKLFIFVYIERLVLEIMFYIVDMYLVSFCLLGFSWGFYFLGPDWLSCSRMFGMTRSPLVSLYFM